MAEVDQTLVGNYDYTQRWVITHLNEDGMRTLCGPAQGRLTHAMEEHAVHLMTAMHKNNRIEANGKLAGVYGLPLEVRPCRCWPNHFDPKDVWFHDDLEPTEIRGVAIEYAGRVWTLPKPYRHHHVIRRIANETGGGVKGPDRQGFYNDLGWFMTRTEAMALAVKSGQLKRREGTQFYQGPELYSEDLW